MTLQQQELEKRDSTKRYDEVGQKIKKLLSATAQTFVPELCDALRADWYPGVSDKGVQNNKAARDNVREKVLNDWSKERGNDTPWLDDTIELWFPDWLKNPSESLKESSRNNIAKGREILKQRRKHSISEREKQKLEDLATKLPDNVIISKPKESSTEGEGLDLEGGRLASYGASGKTISQMKGDITNHAAKLFEALTEIDHMPHKDEDLTVDYIKPTRQYRKSLVLELDDTGRKTVWNYLGSVEAAIQDMLDLLQEEMKIE